jgi:peptidoglycan/LPS O-acetylase OafA/YrhL
MLTFIRKSLSQESSVFLNLIRLVACELVVIGHFLTRYHPVPAEALFRLGSTLGGAAVLLFFVLSGLLISYSLHNKMGNLGYGFRNYFVDRFSRIYSGLLPAMLIGTIIVVLIFVTNHAYFMDLCTMQSTPSLLNFGMTLGMLESFPVDFFSSLLSGFGLSFPLPAVTPYGFNGILWTLVILWWLYMVFGWIAIGSIGFIKKQERSISYKAIFLVVAALLILLLAAMYQQNSSLVVVWFVGVLMMLAISNKTVNAKLSNSLGASLLGVLFILSLAGAVYGLYATVAWTYQYYALSLGLLLSTCVFLGVLFLNAGGSKRIAKVTMNKHVVAGITLGAGFSYTLFVTHYPIIIFLNGLNLPANRYLMFPLILLITNLPAFLVAHFTERKYKTIAKTIKKRLHMSQC